MEDKVFYGTVIFFLPKMGYGFLAWEKDGIKQKDIFVHYTDIASEGFKTLNKDQKVSFGLGSNNKGILKATNVIAVKE